MRSATTFSVRSSVVRSRSERHHAVDDAVPLQVLRRLDAGRERLAVQVLVDPRAEESDSAPGSAAVTWPSDPQDANTPPVVGWRR